MHSTDSSHLQRLQWERFDSARAWPAVGAPRPSSGHGVEATVIEVRVSPDAAADYRGLVAGTVFPVGTTVVAFHRSVEGVPRSVYAMTKLPDGRWEFLVTEPNGSLVARGALAPCASCHDEASADHLFGAPHAAPRN